MKRKFGIVKNAFATGIGNNLISLISGVMIFGTVFAVLQTDMGMTKPEILEIMKRKLLFLVLMKFIMKMFWYLQI